MERVAVRPRPDWRAAAEDLGFDWHTAEAPGGGPQPYWDESAYWRLSAAEVDAIEAATTELHAMCLRAAAHIIAEKQFAPFGVTPAQARLITDSWARREDEDVSLYGRFDLALPGNGDIKMLEYNADTPTGLFEAAVVQWQWLQTVFPDRDQFNSLHEALVARFQEIRLRWQARGIPLDGERREELNTLHLIAADIPEDRGTIAYLAEAALEAGFRAKTLPAEQVGWAETGAPVTRGGVTGWFVDAEDQPIAGLFKLQPWEWMLADAFGEKFLALADAGIIRVIEPAWKMLLSNKAILPVLWRLNPGHALLCEAHADRHAFGRPLRVAAKPKLGREGANISIADLDAKGEVTGAPLVQADGPYGQEGYIYQEAVPLARAAAADGPVHAVVGSWIVGDESRGIGIRESNTLITGNTSRFVPHCFTP